MSIFIESSATQSPLYKSSFPNQFELKNEFGYRLNVMLNWLPGYFSHDLLDFLFGDEQGPDPMKILARDRKTGYSWLGNIWVTIDGPITNSFYLCRKLHDNYNFTNSTFSGAQLTTVK